MEGANVVIVPLLVGLELVEGALDTDGAFDMVGKRVPFKVPLNIDGSLLTDGILDDEGT